MVSNLPHALAVIAVPSLFLWSAAFFVRRGERLRHVSEGLAEAAFRLLDVDDSASRRVSSAGDAARGEIRSLLDDVDGAVNRAAKFESVMHEKIASLERVLGG